MSRIVTTVLILSFVLAGCRTASASPTAPPLAGVPPQPIATIPMPTAGPKQTLAAAPADIAGTWKGNYHGAAAYLIFKDDGSVVWSETPDGTHGLSGTYLFEGTKLDLKIDLKIPDCGSNSTGYYEVAVERRGGGTSTLQFLYVDDICQPRLTTLITDTPLWTRP